MTMATSTTTTTSTSTSTTTTTSTNNSSFLSAKQIDTFLQDGVLVVENVLSPLEIQQSMEQLHQTLAKYGVTLQSPNSLLNNNNNNDSNRNIDIDDIESAKAFSKLSSTNGSGGVLDIFYEDWKMDIATNPKLFQLTTELWKAAYSNTNTNTNISTNTTNKQEQDQGQEKKDNEKTEENKDPFQNTNTNSNTNTSTNDWQYHPYGSFDCNKGYMYIDRIGYRLPTKVSDEMGIRLHEQQQQQQQQQQLQNENGQQPVLQNNQNKSKKKKVQSIQRSLTPHLDCCPETFNKIITSTTTTTKTTTTNNNENNINNNNNNISKKWRPIQCFVSLTENMQPNTGGFEAAKGFHQDFHEWAKHRPPTTIYQKQQQQQKSKDGKSKSTTKLKANTKIEIQIPAPCVGEYTHIRPKEDHEVMERIQHIPVPAGAAVLWDNRIPHANAYRHDGTTPRVVVYCSFLPDIELNRQYVTNQLEKWKLGIPPNDQWNNIPQNNDNNNDNNDNNNDHQNPIISTIQQLSSPLGRKLAGIDEW